MLSAHARAAALAPALAAEAARTDIDGAFPARAIDDLRQAGLLGAPVSAEHGGENLAGAAQTLELLQTLAAVGRGSLVVGRLYEGHVNALQLIALFGSEDQYRAAAADALGGHLFGVWNTEPAGQGLSLVQGTAGAELVGAKTFASGVGQVSRALVTAATKRAPQQDSEAPPGWQMLLLATDRQRPRVDASFWHPLGMRGSGSHAADFSGHRVAADAFIGAPGDYYREPAFSGGAIRFCAVQQGGIEAVFDETRRFLATLGRCGDPFQRARLGEMAWLVESGRQWLLAAARLASDSEARSDDASAGDGPQTGTQDRCEQGLAHARLMRCAIEAHALQVMALSDRAVGARGLLQPEPFERLHRDLTHYLRQPAPDAALVEAGRYVLDDPRPAAALWP